MTPIGVLLWLVGLGLAYAGLLWIAQKVYVGRFRAQAVVVAMLVAFLIGFGVSHPEAPAVSVPSSAPGVSVAPVIPALNAPTDVGAKCAAAQSAGPGGKGHLDTVKVGTAPALGPGQPAVLSAGQSAVITGWAAAADAKQPANAACLVVDGKIVPGVKAVYGTSRPDVAKALGNPTLINSGFALTLPASLIPAGSHTVDVAAVNADASAALVPGEVRVVGPAAAARQ